MAKRRQGRPVRAARFQLSFVGSALEDAKYVPAGHRAKLTSAIRRLTAECCRVADYALSGPPPWPHVYAVHIDGWRIVVAFPPEDEVAVLKIAPHDRAHDPYHEIASDLFDPGLDRTAHKPPCCDPDGAPPAAVPSGGAVPAHDQCCDQVASATRRVSLSWSMSRSASSVLQALRVGLTRAMS